MDRKLADGVLKVQSGEAGRDLMLKVGELAREKKMIKGRQALFIVLRKFKHDIDMGFYFDITGQSVVPTVGFEPADGPGAKILSYSHL